MKTIITLNSENHRTNKISTVGIFLVLMLISGAFAPQYATFARDTSQPELFAAIYKADLARARAAIASGSDVNGIYDRDTMLCWAMRSDNQEITKLILGSPSLEVDKRGFWYDSFGEWERTPLILAAHMGQAQTVSTLLKLGAQINAHGSMGNTALIMAAKRDHTQTIQVLLTQGKGIKVDAQTKGGRTPLSFVVEAEDLSAVKLLHSHGAKINQPDGQGDSMLIGTFLHKKYDVLDFLAAKGANINMVNNSGMTTLMTAITLLGGDDAKTVSGVCT